MRFLVIYKSKFLVVFALICALASSGFAHRFVSKPLDPALTTYVAAGGSLADICGDIKGPSHQNTQTCEACRLVNAAVLPNHDPTCTPPFGRLPVVQAHISDTELRSARLDLTHAARGPPAV